MTKMTEMTKPRITSFPENYLNFRELPHFRENLLPGKGKPPTRNSGINRNSGNNRNRGNRGGCAIQMKPGEPWPHADAAGMTGGCTGHGGVGTRVWGGATNVVGEWWHRGMGPGGPWLHCSHCIPTVASL